VSTPIKVAIADDHNLLRQGIITLLEKMQGIEVAGEVSSGEQAVNFAAMHKPDVFLLDIVMSGMTGIEATRWIKEQNPEIRVILISSEINRDFLAEGIKSGIDGYLNKNIDQATLFAAIEAVCKGNRYFSPEITALVFQDLYQKKAHLSRKKTGLSKREEEILKLIADGKTLKDIAEKLFISTKTVETHKLNIQGKLNLSNVAQLVKYAIETGLVDIKRDK
jgi:DNA-binding NarL/FixJ family response regulator